MTATMFAYVAGSPLLLIHRFGVTSGIYAGLFAATAAGIVLGAFLSGRLLHRVPEQVLLAVGVVLSIAAPVCAAAVLLSGDATLVRLMLCLITATFAYGLIARRTPRWIRCRRWRGPPPPP
jgi:DHA1 family bicyclomycin/chloramphenicol resistance-like MFS transporter